jgi:3-oxoacyl-[acyl-carrier protein] reductase
LTAVNGTVALVTGASRGIGRATAVRLAAAGAEVAINHLAGADRSAEADALQTLRMVQSHGVRGVVIDADVSDAAAVRAMVARIETELGPVGALVNNAGIEYPAPVEEASERDFDRTIAVNVKGQLLAVQAVLAGMRSLGGGRIVNVSSELGIAGRTGMASYCASKAGVIGLTKALARELAGDGILVNCVAPGPTDTDMLPASERTPELIRQIPLGRIGTPDEVAAVICFLVSPENTWTTGQVLSPNGGVVI